MVPEQRSTNLHWSSPGAFVLVAAGATFGLGDIWKFPILAADNGGGAFIALYVLCTLLIGFPLMTAALLVGRRGSRSPVNSVARLARENGRNIAWRHLATLGVLGGCIVLSYLSVVSGWLLAYLVRSADGTFVHVTNAGAESIFSRLVSDPEAALTWHTVFLLITSIVVTRGLHRGLESVIVTMVILSMVLILVLFDHAANTQTLASAVELLLLSDFTQLNYTAFVTGLTHAFFSLSLGTGIMMMYGAYLPRAFSIPRLAAAVILLDTALAIAAGLALLPLVLDGDLGTLSGPGLVFQALPVALGQLQAGATLSCVVYLLLLLIALTTSVALLEPAVVWLMETRHLTRVHATVLAAGGVWILGVIGVLCFNRWSTFTVWGRTGFTLLDFVAANVMLPICALLTVVFVGWVLGRCWKREQLASGKAIFALWRFSLRFVGPIVVLAVLSSVIGVDDFVSSWLG